MSKISLSWVSVTLHSADAADNSCNNLLEPCQKSMQLLAISSLTLACLTSQHLLRVKPVNSVLCKCMKVCAWVVQVVLQSLEIYNDVPCSAVPALTAQHLAAEAQADAEVCMRKLITNLATEVKICTYRPYAVLLHKDQGYVCMCWVYAALFQYVLTDCGLAIMP